MAFSGTQQKCKACDKTVHFIEQISADGVPFHKTCFKCTHCHGQLSISTYHCMEGALYCKAHFEQLFKDTNYKKPSSTSGAVLTKTPSKLSSMFSGTQEKCAVCDKTVYPLEKVTMEGAFYHKNCFRCNHGGCFLSPSNCACLDGILYCKPHFAQLFKEKGSYSHLTKTASMKKNSAPIPAEDGEESKPADEAAGEADAESEGATKSEDQ